MAMAISTIIVHFITIISVHSILWRVTLHAQYGCAETISVKVL